MIFLNKQLALNNKKYKAKIMALAVFFAACSCCGLAKAYTIKTSITYACHEKMTSDVAMPFIENKTIYPDDNFVVPKDNNLNQYIDYLLSDFDFAFSDQIKKFVVFSIIVGSRWPDEQGNSFTNAEALYKMHGDNNEQYVHFLRTAQDDYEVGDLTVIKESKSIIKEILNLAKYYRTLNASDQIVEITQYVDFYGSTSIKVWAPAFYLGVVSHTVLDSFSHTVRNDDLKKIRHVANFIDGLSNSHNIKRDGLAHSMAMDRCNTDAKEIADGAKVALNDFFEIFSSTNSNDLEMFFEQWFTYEPGCNDDNNYCNSKWTALARTDPTKPFINLFSNCSFGHNNTKIRVWTLFFD